MQKCYIWGTGNYSKKVIEYIGINNVDAFIESNPTKEIHCGKKIIASKNLNVGDEDILIVASIYTIEICNFINQNNVNKERVVFFMLDGVDDLIKYAANYGIMRSCMPDNMFEKFINNCGIESMLYNSEFIKAVCEKYGLEYPYTYDEGDGVLRPFSSDKNETQYFEPNLHTVWIGKWYVKKNDGNILFI